jgi:hypothetical protein
MTAERENLDIKTVHADMTAEFPFEDESFDIIFCPVSMPILKVWTICTVSATGF